MTRWKRIDKGDGSESEVTEARVAEVLDGNYTNVARLMAELPIGQRINTMFAYFERIPDGETLPT